jgi:GNAT acetyltransferase-like protein
MAVLDRYRTDDRRALDQLYRRVGGPEAAERLQLTWQWERRQNPAARHAAPWLVREGTAIIGACTALPVRVSIGGRDVTGAWLTDPVVAAERAGQGVHEQLLRAWHRDAEVTLAAAVTDTTRAVLDRLRVPRAIPLPCVVKPLSRRALRRADWPQPVNRLVSAVTLPFVKVVARQRPLRESVEVVRRLDDSADRLWADAAAKIALAVRRDAAYVNWRFAETPHARYTIAVLRRNDSVAGYAVYRHAREPRGRVTHLVDFLAVPGDDRAVKTLLRWIDREARAADSDKIRCHVLHAGFRSVLRRSGYFRVRPTIALSVKVNDPATKRSFYDTTADWHFTLGDGSIDH